MLIGWCLMPAWCEDWRITQVGIVKFKLAMPVMLLFCMHDSRLSFLHSIDMDISPYGHVFHAMALTFINHSYQQNLGLHIINES